ncbi:MAG: SGNH/GDSL hydrolase family protein [Candidatus Saccharimonadales bacterium]
MPHKAIIIGGICLGVVGLFVALEAAFVKYNGKNVPAPNIPRQSVAQGQGPRLNYYVLGDSTAVAQGADYLQGVAIGTANQLANNYAVTMTNLGVSGARTSDVASSQVDQIKTKPDLVMILVGSNDVTHFTANKSVETSLRSITDKLVNLNCDTKIVITGAAQMGAVPRFPQPLRLIAGWRSNQLNKTFRQFSQTHNFTFAELASKTGPTFKNNRSLFAQDNFHPNAQGYAVWTPVLAESLNDALVNQVSHCPQD